MLIHSYVSLSSHIHGLFCMSAVDTGVLPLTCQRFCVPQWERSRSVRLDEDCAFCWVFLQRTPREMQTTCESLSSCLGSLCLINLTNTCNAVNICNKTGRYGPKVIYRCCSYTSVYGYRKTNVRQQRHIQQIKRWFYHQEIIMQFMLTNLTNMELNTSARDRSHLKFWFVLISSNPQQNTFFDCSYNTINSNHQQRKQVARLLLDSWYLNLCWPVVIVRGAQRCQ